MSKLNYESNINNTLNLRIKSQTDAKKLRKIRKTLLSLIVMEIEASKSYNVTVIKNNQSENEFTTPAIIPRNFREDLEQTKQNNVNNINNINKINIESSEHVNSSDFEDSDEEF